MKAIYNTIYWIFMAAVLALGGLLIATLVPVAGNIQVKIVKSGSMEPVIMTGSIVVDRPAPAYHVGDIVTFGADTKTQIPTTHRIVAINGEGSSATITTKGDANDAPDPNQTSVSLIHGKVLFTVPYVGYLLAFARQPLGFGLLVGIPALAIILEEVLKIIREVSAMRRKKRNQAILRVSHGMPQRTSPHVPQQLYTQPRKRIIVD